jgi:hypothetical protein
MSVQDLGWKGILFTRPWVPEACRRSDSLCSQLLARFDPLTRYSGEDGASDMVFGGWRRVRYVTSRSQSGGSRAHSKDASHPGSVRSSSDSSSLGLRHRKPHPLPSLPRPPAPDPAQRDFGTAVSITALGSAVSSKRLYTGNEAHDRPRWPLLGSERFKTITRAAKAESLPHSQNPASGIRRRMPQVLHTFIMPPMSAHV